jgi:glycosyltransferase involved in cell wall biosynthesis
MASPQVTVLMTVYNGGEYLKPSIESVLQQTFKDFEFLIVEDCSSDQSVEDILSFADERIRLVKNETNLGQTCSLNKGLSLAKGRYIARIDADDFVFSTWLEKNLTLLQEQPLVAVASCKAIVINGDHKIQKTLRTPCCYEQMVLRSLTATPLNHVGSIYKKDVIVSMGGYDEEFKIAADFELWSKLIRHKIHLASTDELLVAVRVHEKSESIVHRGRTDIVEISEIMKRNFDTLVEFQVSRQDVALLWKLNYMIEQLNVPEFQDAIDLLCKAYKTIKPEFAVSVDSVQLFIAYQKKVFYAKRALDQIAQGQLPELRALMHDYCRARGYFNVFFLLWLGSWFGKSFLIGLSWGYQRWCGFLARKRVLRQIQPGFIL